MDRIDALNVIRKSTDEFATSLVRQWDRYSRLSDKQWMWVERLAARAGQPVATAPVVNLANVIKLFATAAKKLKYPKLTFFVDGTTIRFQVAGERSRCPGTINVTDGGSYGQNTWYGRIDRNGEWLPSAAATPAVIDLVKRLGEDLIAAAVQHGHHTGHCCFCALQLKDERSTSVGYGPICADKWELPWGSKH